MWHEKLLLALTTIALLMMAISLVVVPIVLIRLPDDYFQRPLPDKPVLCGKVLLRNALGLVFMAVGVVLLFLPGQGVLMIGAGLWLTDFPGKRKLVHHLLCHPKVLRGINRLRKKAGKKPLLA